MNHFRDRAQVGESTRHDGAGVEFEVDSSGRKTVVPTKKKKKKEKREEKKSGRARVVEGGRVRRTKES